MSLLKKYRKENKLTQKQMAKKLEISFQAYRNYELGKRSIPIKVMIQFLRVRNTESDKRIIKEIENLYQ